MRTFGFVVCVVFIVLDEEYNIDSEKSTIHGDLFTFLLFSCIVSVLTCEWRRVIHKAMIFISVYRFYDFWLDDILFCYFHFYFAYSGFIHSWIWWLGLDKQTISSVFSLSLTHRTWHMVYWILDRRSIAMSCVASLFDSTCWDASTRERLCILCNESALTSAAIYEMMMICLFQYCAFVSHRVGTRHMMLKYA